MITIPDDAKHFLDREHFVIISTIDSNRSIHTSAKGIVDIDKKGKIFILDLYKGKTHRNIKKNPSVTLTSINEHAFRGYSISGTAKIAKEGSISKRKLKLWHDKLAKRIARRVIRHVKSESLGKEGIPEADFPLPKYLIEVRVKRIVDLAPSGPSSRI